jgi:hypothetical protein
MEFKRDAKSLYGEIGVLKNQLLVDNEKVLKEVQPEVVENYKFLKREILE